jgi:hypothetical protein
MEDVEQIAEGIEISLLELLDAAKKAERGKSPKEPV